MKAKQRLFLTACCTMLVAEGNGDAATLYAGVGDEIPDSAAEKFGLVDGRLPDADPDAPDAPGPGAPVGGDAAPMDAAAAGDVAKNGDGKVETTVAPASDAAAIDGAKEAQAADDKEQTATADKEAKAGGKKSAAGASK